MLNHLLALIAITALCAAWMLFQLWLGRQDPDRKAGFRPGCGSCGNGACGRRDTGARGARDST